MMMNHDDKNRKETPVPLEDNGRKEKKGKEKRRADFVVLEECKTNRRGWIMEDVGNLYALFIEGQRPRK